VNYTIDLAEKQGFHVFNIVIRGYGKSTHLLTDLGDAWYDVWARDACDFADTMNINTFFYTGVSHGAGIGWHLCVNHPERLRGFFGVVAGPNSKDGVETGEARMRTVRAAATVERWNAFCDDMERKSTPVRKKNTDDAEWALQLKLFEEQMRFWRGMALEEGRLNVKKPFPALKSEEELIAVLGKITVPTLLMGGMHDVISLPQNLLRSCGAIKGSKLVLYEDATHGLDKEHKDEIVSDIMEFCRARNLF
jgi:pimeloyl-ACP methyl ester carboxylesterase